MQPLRRGAEGVAVAEVRRILAGLGLLSNTNPLTDSYFDEPTELAIRHFQQRRGISVDGAVGPETFSALAAARWQLGDRVLAHNATTMLVGDDVTALQTQLLELGYDLVRADGIFGRGTDEALRSFQREQGLVPDGVCGPSTLRVFKQLGRRVVGGRPQLLREQAAVWAAGPRLFGKRIVLDPGHGGDDPGVSQDGICEADLAWDLATRLEGRLAALGVTTWLTRGPHNSRTDEERALFANDVRADLLLSLHVDAAPSPLANGVASYHYGAGESTSTIGEQLAELAQRELVARTGLLNGRVHGKSWTTLRLTRMPAVRVEVGYLSSPVDRARLLDPSFRDTVAEGLLVAVQRLYLRQADDPPTGVMRIPLAG
ncbi:MAG: N-acetylmuramoyl-L-alanine amidase [Actinomycetota bacterium]